MKKKDRLEIIKERMTKAELAPWKKKRGSFGWTILEPKGAWGRYDVLIASGLCGDTAEFLANVPDDMKWMSEEIQELRHKLSQRRKKSC